jgi:hypothetical protein
VNYENYSIYHDRMSGGESVTALGSGLSLLSSGRELTQPITRRIYDRSRSAANTAEEVPILGPGVLRSSALNFARDLRWVKKGKTK